MPLEDLKLLRTKNRKRLRDLKNITFLLGLNITEPSTFKDKLSIITITLIISSYLNIYGQVCYIIRHKDNIVMMTECICTMLQTMISIIKITYFPFVQKRFRKVLRMIESHELVEKIAFLSHEETPYNKKLRKDARRIINDCWNCAKCQYNFYMSACIAAISYYFFFAQFVNAYNWHLGNTNHTKILPYPSLFPFWEDKMNKLPYYGFVTFLGGSANLTAGIGATCFDGMFIIIAQHCVALFQILKPMIKLTTSPEVPRNLRLNYLIECIDHHERTFQFCKEFNNLYLHVSIVQFVLSLVILGVVMFQAAFGLENDIVTVVRMILYLAAAGFEIVIYCLNGQMVFNESDSLSNAWYGSEWYNESKQFQLTIQMMIMRANRVFYMRASWFSTMSLATLLALVKTSGSYFMLLRKFDN